MTVRYKVPAADIVEAWKAQKAKYEVDLQEALATQKDLREKDVNDSCVNGKVDHGRRCILVLDLQIKYIDHDEDIYLGDHEMLNIFSAPGHLNGPTGMGAEVAQERRY